jgi:hypothetical protein
MMPLQAAPARRRCCSGGKPIEWNVSRVCVQLSKPACCGGQAKPPFVWSCTVQDQPNTFLCCIISNPNMLPTVTGATPFRLPQQLVLSGHYIFALAVCPSAVLIFYPALVAAAVLRLAVTNRSTPRRSLRTLTSQNASCSPACPTPGAQAPTPAAMPMLPAAPNAPPLSALQRMWESRSAM